MLLDLLVLHKLYKSMYIQVPTMNQLVDLKSENELTIKERQENTKVENVWALGDYRGKSVIQFSRERN
jgi:thioredoxin reductase